MTLLDPIQQELDKAKKGLEQGNDGLARVCARRAVALGVKRRKDKHGRPEQQGDALHHLRTLQSQEIFPLEIREAAQRLLTPVTEINQIPLSTDPIADARLILTYLDQLS